MLPIALKLFKSCLKIIIDLYKFEASQGKIARLYHKNKKG
jgi:hypothetical protein